MRRPAAPVSDSVVAAVRRHFNLGQHELAAWLGLSEATIGHLETGRRGLSPEAAAHLPPPGAGAAAGALRLASAAAPALALAPPEAAPLVARLDYLSC